MPTPLEKVAADRARCRKARGGLKRAESMLWRSVLRAHRAGFSLRQISAAAGVSHETVRTIIRKEQA